MTSSASTRPSRSTPTTVTSTSARADRVANTRMLDRRRHDVTRRARKRSEHRGMLTDSVPEDVNTTSRGRASTNAATCSRACSNATRRHLAFGVQAPGIAERFGEERQHRFARGRPERRGGCVVEVRALPLPPAPSGARPTAIASSGALPTRSHASDAVLIAAGPALGDRGIGLAVETFEHPFHHAGVDRAQHVRVLPGRFAERAVLGDERERIAVRLGVRGEAVRGRARRRPTPPRLSPTDDLRSVPSAPRSRGRTRSRLLRPARGPRRSAGVRGRGRAWWRASRRAGAGTRAACRSRRRGNTSTGGPRSRAGRARRRGSRRTRASRGGGGPRWDAPRSARRCRPPSRPAARRAHRGRCHGASDRRMQK